MNRNLAWKLNWYRQSELEGAMLLGRMAGAVSDGKLIEKLTRHAAEEAEHSRIWEETIRELGLPHIRIHRSYQSFYLGHMKPPATVLEVLCFTQIFERRVHQRFTAEAADPEIPQPARVAFHRMIEDEKDHLGWVAKWLRKQPGAAEWLQLYQQIDQQVLTELLPYEHCIHDIPGLGRELRAASCQPDQANQQPDQKILADGPLASRAALSLAAAQ